MPIEARLKSLLTTKISAPLAEMWVWSLAGVLILFDLPSTWPFSDFTSVWAGAKIAILGKVSSLYVLPEYQRLWEQVLAMPGGHRYDPEFSYPPHLLLLILPFGLLPFTLAYISWNIAGLSTVARLLRKNPLSRLDWRSVALVIACPACVLNALDAQNGAFTAACFVGGLALSETSPIWAGVLFGILTVKPHLGLLIPLTLLLRRNWRCIASATLTSLGLVGLSFAVWGPDLWTDYVTRQIPSQMSFLHKLGGANWLYAYQLWWPGVYADLMFRVKLPEPVAYALYGAAVMFSLACCLFIVWREGLTPRGILALALTTLIVLPYGSSYDMVMIMVALSLYLREKRDITMVFFLLCGLLWALPVMLPALKYIHIPISSMIMIGTLAGLFLASRAEGKLRSENQAINRPPSRAES